MSLIFTLPGAMASMMGDLAESGPSRSAGVGGVSARQPQPHPDTAAKEEEGIQARIRGIYINVPRGSYGSIVSFIAARACEMEVVIADNGTTRKVQADKLVLLNDEGCVVEEDTYPPPGKSCCYAYEVFTTTPFHLYRTVRP